MINQTVINIGSPPLFKIRAIIRMNANTNQRVKTQNYQIENLISETVFEIRIIAMIIDDF